MSVNEIRLSQVCREGDKQWMPLAEKDFPELFQVVTSHSEKFPEQQNRRDSAYDTDYFVIRPKRVIQPRLHERYETAVYCSILSSTKTFKTATIDLSEGGLYFKDLIPEWVAGYFIVAVHGLNSSDQTQFQLMCSLVEDQKEKKRVQIVSEEQDPQFLLYKEWLLTLKK